MDHYLPGFMAKKARAATGKSLVIVESPAKAKTINKYLGPGYDVHASMGHVRDLPSKGISVDIEHDFEPTYEITPGRRKTVASLKSSAKSSDNLYLATDLDREGEAIAWHLSEVLGFPAERTYRVVFNEITKTAIAKAFEAPGKLDMDKVMAQQARRILDRIVGYKISPLLWRKVAKGLSAGRVQSVAVKMIVEREMEIRNFKEEEYWLIPTVLSTDLKSDLGPQWAKFSAVDAATQKGPTVVQQNEWLAGHKAFRADLYQVGEDRFEAPTKERAEKILAGLKAAAFKVADVKTRRTDSRPAAPFITSTLQQAAANTLGFSTDRTMRIAQQLYEGVELGSEGMVGLITYMRTDSTHLSQQAIQDSRAFIAASYGAEYLPQSPNMYTPKKGAQEAHEAIRPSNPGLTPDDAGKYLTDDQYKLYDLIWRRAIACQMSAAQYDVTSLEIAAESKEGTCKYRATGRVLVFDGFTRVLPVKTVDQELPRTATGDALAVVDIKAEMHKTKPPARYTEASLVKALEREGIGRPSTYASIISTIQDRKYVEQIDRKFHATDIGEVVTKKLEEGFPKIMDLAFTRHMEEELDKIEEQHLSWMSVLKEFYGPFKEDLDKAMDEMKHAKAETMPSEYKCEKCGKPMVYRFGRNGRFLSCSGYPDCDFAVPCDKSGKPQKDEVSEFKCPECGKPMLVKSGRFGKFLGCSDYPNCKTIQRLGKDGQPMPKAPPAEPTGVKCHKCKTGEFVIRQSKRGPFLGCNKFPRCRTLLGMAHLENLKKLQAEGKWPAKNQEELDTILGRDKKTEKGGSAGRKKKSDSVRE
jgi:DNA topoisomerase I